MASDVEHTRLLESLGNLHEKRIVDSLQSLEERITKIMASAPTRAGQLFDLQWAIAARRDIMVSMESEFLQTSNDLVNEYSKVSTSAASMVANYGKFESFVGVSDDVLRSLKQQSFQGFQDIAGTFLNDISDEVYQNTLTGRSFSESVKNIKQKINGVYAASDDVEIQRLVNIANAGGSDAEDALKELHSVYAADKLGNNMRRYSTQMVHDSLMQFDASVVVNLGKETGATGWLYTGSIVNDSRKFCIDHLNKTYTEEEISKIWQQNWSGKSSGDPFIVRGGYNCRHHWRPVYGDEIATTPANKKVEVDKVLPSIYSTSDKITIDSINNVIKSIPDAEDRVAKLSTFLKSKDIKTLYLKGGQLSIFGKSSRAIQDDVTKYLSEGKSELQIKSIMFAGRTNYSLRNSSRVNGFTSNNYDHIVVKVPTTVNYKKTSALEIGQSIKEKVGLSLGRATSAQDWSFSSVQSVEGQVVTTTLHELGHQVHYWAGSPKRPMFANSRVTRYSETNDAEFHAEHFVAWLTNRSELVKFNEPLAKYFDDLIDKATLNNIKIQKGLSF